MAGTVVTAKGQPDPLDSSYPQGRIQRKGVGAQEPPRRLRSDLLWPVTLNQELLMSRERPFGMDTLNVSLQDLNIF